MPAWLEGREGGGGTLRSTRPDDGGHGEDLGHLPRAVES